MSGGISSMNKTLSVLQLVLAILYVMAGIWKLTGEGPILQETMPGFSLFLIHAVGLAETLAGLCLALPVIVRKWDVAAAWAGAFLAVEAAIFVVHHLRHGAYGPAAVTLVLGLLASFIAWKRFKTRERGGSATV